jgi:hypothetical protein
VIGLLIAFFAVTGAIALGVVRDLLREEIRGWLELLPVVLLRAVLLLVPADQRKELYEQEWLPDLLCHLRDAEGRPITRLVVGVKFSVCLIGAARAVARDLRDVKEVVVLDETFWIGLAEFNSKQERLNNAVSEAIEQGSWTDDSAMEILARAIEENFNRVEQLLVRRGADAPGTPPG